ncbi:RDD family protein [Algibacter sp. 2305UL17-15]|uniref:RDD family protein n=1 Tax=Algibacter sp. 2305UL17-15 TaxID=3231268 RepID=UPI00345AF2A9
MSELQINTTQNVKINFTAAGVGERLVAFIIDAIIIIVYISIMGAFIEVFGEMEYWEQKGLEVIAYFPATIYTLALESFLNGQTIGKRILKIKVVKLDGFQTTLSDYVVRWFFRIADVFMLGLGFFVIIFSKKQQRLGDMAAGTGVVSLKDKVNINHTILEQLKTDYKPTYPNVIKLSDNDARIIKDTFIRARAGKDYSTLIKLRDKLIEVVGIKEVKQSSDIEFIDVILKDYNYYTQDM